MYCNIILTNTFIYETQITLKNGIYSSWSLPLLNSTKTIYGFDEARIHYIYVIDCTENEKYYLY